MRNPLGKRIYMFRPKNIIIKTSKADLSVQNLVLVVVGLRQILISLNHQFTLDGEGRVH